MRGNGTILHFVLGLEKEVNISNDVSPFPLSCSLLAHFPSFPPSTIVCVCVCVCCPGVSRRRRGVTHTPHSVCTHSVSVPDPRSSYTDSHTTTQPRTGNSTSRLFCINPSRTSLEASANRNLPDKQWRREKVHILTTLLKIQKILIT